MYLLDQIAEARIAEAIERGELDDLPGSGSRLDLDDDALVPPGLRVAYRILKNAGFLPEELQLRRELHAAEDLLACAIRPEERTVARGRLRLLQYRLSMSRSRRGASLQLEQAYFEKLRERLER
jgi:hypothetical protein